MYYVNFFGISFCLILSVFTYSSEGIEDIINNSTSPLMIKNNANKESIEALSHAELENHTNHDIIKFLQSSQKEEEIDEGDLKKNNRLKLVIFFRKHKIFEGKDFDQRMITFKKTAEFLKNHGFEIFE